MNKLLTATVIFTISLITLVPLANYFGICFKSGRLIYDQEKIESAVDFVIYRMGGYVEIEPEVGRIEIQIPEDFYRYSSAAEFIRENPECCRVKSRGIDGYTPGLYQRVMGRYCSTVIVRYLIKYKFQGKWKHEWQTRSVALTNCGDSWSGNLR